MWKDEMAIEVGDVSEFFGTESAWHWLFFVVKFYQVVSEVRIANMEEDVEVGGSNTFADVAPVRFIVTLVRLRNYSSNI